MSPIQTEALVRDSRERIARYTNIDRTLAEGGRLWPDWLDRFANWWANAVAPLRLGASIDQRRQ